jgi:nitrogen regulatory protein PII
LLFHAGVSIIAYPIESWPVRRERIVTTNREELPEMKRIEVIIESHKLGEVCDALKTIGIDDVTTSEISDGGGFQVGRSDIRLEIVVSAERAAVVIRAFAGPDWRVLLGDGKMLVYEIADPVRARSSEPREHAH